MMERTIETEGARYDLFCIWDYKKDAVKINLKINARDWKKPSNLEMMFAENNFPFILNISKILGCEEEWPGENGTEIDYASVHLVLTVRSKDGKEMYKDTIDTSGKFHHDITFYIKPENKNGKN